MSSDLMVRGPESRWPGSWWLTWQRKNGGALAEPQMSTGLLATGATGLWKYLGVAGAVSRCLSPFFPAVTKGFGPMTVGALAPEPQGSMATGLNGIFRFPVSGDLQAD